MNKVAHVFLVLMLSLSGHADACDPWDLPGLAPSAPAAPTVSEVSGSNTELSVSWTP